MPRYAFPALTPMYGLGSGSRIVGAIAISSPYKNWLCWQNIRFHEK